MQEPDLVVALGGLRQGAFEYISRAGNELELQLSRTLTASFGPRSPGLRWWEPGRGSENEPGTGSAVPADNGGDRSEPRPGAVRPVAIAPETGPSAPRTCRNTCRQPENASARCRRRHGTSTCPRPRIGKRPTGAYHRTRSAWDVRPGPAPRVSSEALRSTSTASGRPCQIFSLDSSVSPKRKIGLARPSSVSSGSERMRRSCRRPSGCAHRTTRPGAGVPAASRDRTAGQTTRRR